MDVSHPTDQFKGQLIPGPRLPRDRPWMAFKQIYITQFSLMNRAGGGAPSASGGDASTAPDVTVYWSSVSGNMVVYLPMNVQSYGP